MKTPKKNQNLLIRIDNKADLATELAEKLALKLKEKPIDLASINHTELVNFLKMEITKHSNPVVEEDTGEYLDGDSRTLNLPVPKIYPRQSNNEYQILDTWLGGQQDNKVDLDFEFTPKPPSPPIKK